MNKVERADWDILDKPSEFIPLGYSKILDDRVAEMLLRGNKPQDMDDKWFIYREDGWVYFHRSWTGDLIYWIKLDGSPNGVRVVESFAARDSTPYTYKDAQEDLDLLDQLIDTYSQDVDG